MIKIILIISTLFVTCLFFYLLFFGAAYSVVEETNGFGQKRYFIRTSDYCVASGNISTREKADSVCAYLIKVEELRKKSEFH